ncbi:DUF4253 domain-containing protein [Anaerobiospirillum sp. NML120449]|uniref:DUF4253 domain-containing protein n=1 Tax=Anaerobiospirillum sp. NML120449 TaxID=2932817 RepID=UPI001FF17A65|nr:DUF4253 domain-containing protein [Anaerobiospirillum sp. NML120449]MCK0526400.1 DUF4253 domain-containing protein [Anaerobiospirillum sp. NML120449]
MEIENLSEMKNYALELGLSGENAWSHAAAITYWAVSKEFIAPEYVSALDGLDIVGVRKWLNDTFDSSFSDEIFNEDAADFLRDYYNVDRGPSFIHDFELFVIEDSELLEDCDGDVSDDKFDEATLNIVCDDDFADYFCDLLDERYEEWSETVYRVSDNDERIFECPVMPAEVSDQDVTVDNSSLAVLCNTYNRFAGGCGTFYRPGTDDYVLGCDFNYRFTELAGPDNTRPLMVVLTEQLVRDTITLSCPRSATQFLDFSEMEANNSIAGVLREAGPVYEGTRALLDDLFESNFGYLLEAGMSMDEIENSLMEYADDLQEGDNFDFATFWEEDEDGEDDDSGEVFHCPVLLCDLPVDYSWQTLAYVQFTATGDAIGQVELMGIARYLEEEYGLCVAAVSDNSIEFAMQRDLSTEQASRAARDLFALCPDVLSMPDLYTDDCPEGVLAGLNLLTRYLELNRTVICVWPCDEEEDDEQNADNDGEGAFSF